MNIVENLDELKFDFSYSGKKELSNGLEMNFSRGCGNSCLFCSKIQGRIYRKLPVKNIEQLLTEFKYRIKELGLSTENSSVLNINDDDLLQDLSYAESVLNKIKERNFTVWGIQSSITSFFNDLKSVKHKTIDLVSDKNLYKDGVPLLWLGTDTFIRSRGKRLGKPLPEFELFNELISEFEINNIDNYHYWISSDHETNWDEFIEELLVIYDLSSTFSRFSILPHSPFLIPYHSTPVYKLISRLANARQRIEYREIRRGIDPVFDLMLVEHVNTGFHSLNRLLSNVKLPGKHGFFDYLKNGEFKEAFICAYSFIKEEQMSSEKFLDIQSYKNITDAERKLSEVITKII